MPEGVVAYIAVGANIEPEKHIVRALELLSREVDIMGISTFYATPAYGRPEQPEYRNGVIEVRALHSARGLKFRVLRIIELALGRVRTDDKYAARTIDLDLLLYGDALIDQEGLRVPDPDLRTRIFLAQPLLDLAPGLILPDTGECVASLEILRREPAPTPAPNFTALLKERFAP
jgi:2-amino-4-hydroxy-6-hydroxymethyldihydropteridine diphosphokinase